MTPAFHTAYSLTLFLTLVALNLWTGRRHRIPRALRAGAHPPPYSGQ